MYPCATWPQVMQAWSVLDQRLRLVDALYWRDVGVRVQWVDFHTSPNANDYI